MRVHKLTFAALAVAASLSLTACQNDDGGTTGQSDSSAAATASSQDGGTGGGSGSGQGGGAQDFDGAGSAGKSSSAQGTARAVDPAWQAGPATAWCHADDLGITAADNTIKIGRAHV